MLKIQIEELEMLVATVNCGNFSKAAEELGVTASVVSRTIKKLENKLNTTLFNRTTRKTQLTQEGQWLFNEASAMIAQGQRVESQLGERTAAPAGRLVVDAATPFSLHAIAPLIAGFNQEYPDVTVIMTSTESNIDLIERKVDIAIRIGHLTDSTLKARKLGETSRQLYASPSYIDKYGLPKSPSDLKQHNCLGFVKPDRLNVWPLQDKNKNAIHIVPKTYADNGETLRQLAIQGCGIACLSRFTVNADVQAGHLRPILESDIQPESIPIYAVFYSDNEVNPRMRCFLDYISEHIVLK